MSGSRFIRIKVWEKCVLSSEKFVFLSVCVFEVVWGFENTSHQFTCWQWGKGFSQLRQFKDSKGSNREHADTALWVAYWSCYTGLRLWLFIYLCIVYINELVVTKGAKSKVFKATRSHSGILEASFASA